MFHTVFSCRRQVCRGFAVSRSAWFTDCIYARPRGHTGCNTWCLGWFAQLHGRGRYAYCVCYHCRVSVIGITHLYWRNCEAVIWRDMVCGIPKSTSIIMFSMTHLIKTLIRYVLVLKALCDPIQWFLNMVCVFILVSNGAWTHLYGGSSSTHSFWFSRIMCSYVCRLLLFWYRIACVFV